MDINILLNKKQMVDKGRHSIDKIMLSYYEKFLC